MVSLFTAAGFVLALLHDFIERGLIEPDGTFGAAEFAYASYAISEETTLEGLRQLEESGIIVSAGSRVIGAGNPCHPLWALRKGAE